MRGCVVPDDLAIGNEVHFYGKEHPRPGWGDTWEFCASGGVALHERLYPVCSVLFWVEFGLSDPENVRCLGGNYLSDCQLGSFQALGVSSDYSECRGAGTFNCG